MEVSGKSERLGTVMLAALAALLLMDASAIWVRPRWLAACGVVVWAVFLTLLAGYALYCVWRLCEVWKRAGYGWITLCTVTALAIIFISETIDARSLSHEATQQVGCTMRQLYEPDADFGFWRSCHLGHFTRQYYLFALPTLLGERTQFALNIGGLLYLLMGLAIFAWGALNRLPHSLGSDLLVALLMLLPLQWHYFNWGVLLFDESIFPCAMSFMFVGLILVIEKHVEESKLNIPLYALAAFCLVLSAYAYTPALATFCLGVVWLPLLVRRQCRWMLNLPVLVVLLGSGIVAAVLSGDLKLGMSAVSASVESAATLERLVRGFEHLLFDTRYPPGTTIVFRVVFIACAVLSLTSLRLAFLMCWCVFTIAAAFVTKGYAMPPVELALHRATVMLPVFLYVLMQVWATWVAPRKGSVVALIAMFTQAWIVGLQQFYVHQATRPIDRDLKFLSEVQRVHFPAGLASDISVLIGNDLGARFLPICDTLNYFAGNCQRVLLDRDCRYPTDPPLRQNQRITVLTPQDRCNVFFAGEGRETAARFAWNNEEVLTYRGEPRILGRDHDYSSPQ